MGKKIDWLNIARELQSIGQNGLTFANDQHDIDRFKKLYDTVSNIISNSTNLDEVDIKKSLINQKGYATPKFD